MIINQILPNVFLVKTTTKQDLGRIFLRFQEHYESPFFKGKIFSLEEFEKWYTDEYGEFTYYEDWDGFNIPSNILEPFKKGQFGELSDFERDFLNHFSNIEGTFYVIGSNDDQDTLEHEICHALFYIDDIYRKNVSELINNNINSLRSVFNKMKDMGYHDDVALDEVHAYVSANPDWLDSNKVPYDKGLTYKLRELKQLSLLRQMNANVVF